jgi:hypothetical protein
MSEQQTLPVIQSLNDITTNGYYQIDTSKDLVVADCIGLSEFKTCKLPPTRIVKSNGVIYQIMIDAHDVKYFRVIVPNGKWGPWVPLAELLQLFPTSLSK